ncbi:MAG: hypothetical protein NC831_07140 [Candidatus Omnitrophica bacterium]|nr:hypothetical protein [Candidatus Omnitrophota bacterium]MCM8829062.1 hypothetical protein [Candidatus Omnitrophota bacterium]
MKKVITVLSGILALINLTASAYEFEKPLIRIINLPFPPYQRSVSKLFETGNGKIYGIISESRFHRGIIFSIEQDEKIVLQEKLPDDILQVDSVIFNPEITWTWDRTLKKIITLDKSGVLKVYDRNDSGKEIMRISGTRPFEPHGYQVSRSFAFDKDGNIYTAGKDGFLFKLDPETQKIEKLKLKLPSIAGREPWASLDAAALADNGTIYLGTFDGYIVEFNPVSQKLINLGKPLRQQRIQGLVYYKGIIFGIGGEEDGLPRWFLYNPETRGFELCGTLKDEKGRLINEPVNTLIIAINKGITGSFSGRLGCLFKIELGKKGE